MDQERTECEQKLKEVLRANVNADSKAKMLLERLEGRQPTLDVMGQLFFVHYNGEQLERKGDEPYTIDFNDLEYFLAENGKNYNIPFDTGSRKFVTDLNQDELTEIPRNVVIVSFPQVDTMDPVGYAQAGGWDLQKTVAKTPQLRHFSAKQAKGQHDWLRYIVNSNRADRGMPPLKNIAKSKGNRM